jgi:hypothetical protein
MISDLLDWIIPFIVLIIFIRFIRKVVDHVKGINEMHEYHEDIEKFYKELLAQKLRQAAKNNNSKWFKLDKSSKDKIMKVKVMSERGETEGECHAAKGRLNALLLKNNLILSDIPDYKK